MLNFSGDEGFCLAIAGIIAVTGVIRFYNLLATIGLRSSPLGGFGGRLPLPSGG